MYIWKFLGIEPTADIAAIKRAFAREAKKYHPEEYPEEYKNLRSAYKQAVEYAKQQSKDMTAEKKTISQESVQPLKVEKQDLTTASMQKSVLERLDLKAISLEKKAADKIEIPHVRDTVPEKPVLERPKMEVPHLQDSVPPKPHVKKTPVEPVKLEMPKIKELLLETQEMEVPALEVPHISDPIFHKIERRMRKRELLQSVTSETEFSFAEVENALSPEAIEEFLYYFQAIVCNPILRDNIECWMLYLEKKEFHEVYLKEDVCKRMIEILGKYFWGEKDTLLYFVYFLNIKSGRKMKEMQTFFWKIKRCVSLFHKGQKEKILTEEEQNIHNTILTDLRKRNIIYDLEHFEVSREEYMDAFFDIIKDNHEVWKQRWKQFQRERIKKGCHSILRRLLLPLALLLFLLVVVKIFFTLG